MTKQVAFALESYAANSINCFKRIVDADGLPSFNMFWTEPAEAVHDWPDFGDVMSRQFKGAIMLRRMTGKEAATEKVWQRKILSVIDPLTDNSTRPETSYCKPAADWGDAALTLYALVAAAIDSGEHALRKAAVKMAEGMLGRMRSGGFPGDCFAVKELMGAADLVGYPGVLIELWFISDSGTPMGMGMAIDEIVITGTLITSVEGKDTEPSLPQDFALNPPYPNPFNAWTTIGYRVPEAEVHIGIYNVRGQLVRTLAQGSPSAGSYVQTWDGRDSGGEEVESGIYFCWLHSENVSLTRKLVLLR